MWTTATFKITLFCVTAKQCKKKFTNRFFIKFLLHQVDDSGNIFKTVIMSDSQLCDLNVLIVHKRDTQCGTQRGTYRSRTGAAWSPRSPACPGWRRWSSLGFLSLHSATSGYSDVGPATSLWTQKKNRSLISNKSTSLDWIRRNEKGRVVTRFHLFNTK